MLRHLIVSLTLVMSLMANESSDLTLIRTRMLSIETMQKEQVDLQRMIYSLLNAKECTLSDNNISTSISTNLYIQELEKRVIWLKNIIYLLGFLLGQCLLLGVWYGIKRS
nr:MAG TPA: hypothetical protein [Caudoviricetes sp.]